MLHAIVMAGGSGTRFWPKSRRNLPKQLLRLYGDETMLQQTVARVAPMVPAERTWIITGADQAEATRAQLPHLSPDHVVAEPCPRDTAPCVGLAAQIVAHNDPDGVMLVMPADHVIEPQEKFLQTLRAAVAVIADDHRALVTFGIKPTRPETGYGYIKRGPAQAPKEGIAVFGVERFCEKPDRPTAEQFLADGGYLWNAGIFVWRAHAILHELATHQPAIAGPLARVSGSLGTEAETATLAREFPLMTRIPIDKAVMEKSSHVRVLEVVYNWNDVGDWRALTTLQPPDSSGNTIQGPVYAVATRNSFIVADQGTLIVTLGVDDLVIVQAAGATLIARKDQLDKLKDLVNELDKKGFGSYL